MVIFVQKEQEMCNKPAFASTPNDADASHGQRRVLLVSEYSVGRGRVFDQQQSLNQVIAQSLRAQE